MRTTLLCLALLFIISCKTKEQPVTSQEPTKATAYNYSYDVDTLKSLNEYIPLLSKRKLWGEHYCYTVISNVNVVDVKAGTVLSGHTVVLHDNVIEAVLAKGEERPKIEEQYRVLEIDGTGKYLAPGLCDMHTHYICSNAMRLHFLVNGITTVRNANGTQVHRDEQFLLSTQQLLGPNCYSTFAEKASPWLRDTSWPKINPPTWLCIDQGIESKKLQSVFALAEKHSLRISIDAWTQLPEINYPDNAAFEQWTSMEMLQRRSNFRTFWFFSKFYADSVITHSTTSALALDVLKSTPGQFCIGTESQRNTSWRTSPLVNEMKFLAAHQVPNITILQIATRNAGIFANAGVPANNSTTDPAWFGEIKEGYRADLVLLEKNPLTDVAGYERPQSVFVKGVYLNANDLGEMRKAISKFD